MWYNRYFHLKSSSTTNIKAELDFTLRESAYFVYNKQIIGWQSWSEVVRATKTNIGVVDQMRYNHASNCDENPQIGIGLLKGHELANLVGI